MVKLVSGDSQTLLVVDTAYLEIKSLSETPTMLPTAPGLTNHLVVQVTVVPNKFGSNMETVVQMLNCALISESGTSEPVEHTYFSELTIVREDYDQLAPPTAIKIEFIIQSKDYIPHQAIYCIKLAFNN
jgi:hypothetical protein